MRKTLLALAMLSAGALAMGAATAASAMQFNQAGAVQPGAGVQLVHGHGHGHGHHHGRFLRGGVFMLPLVTGSCYSNCRAYHGPRYCHAQCGY
jgi:hypothetical protein